MASINEIELNGFKAFPSKFQLTLGGKNLLLYGENGSGKSSIYYALHCIFNSFRKEDKGKKYFDKDNPQNLINKVFTPKTEGDIPYILVNWAIGARKPFISTITKDGCDQSFARLAELDTCFINHQFLFSFFNFTNSKDANLFPIFQREILPYIFSEANGTYISLMYEQIINASSKLSNQSSSKVINEMIAIFNNCLEQIIGDINLKVSDVYNTHFKEDGELPLSIILSYPNVNPYPDVFFNGFRLKWDYPLIVNSEGTLKKAPNKSLIEPIIRIDIKENGVLIKKPHVYFNEAKLTAIALSIRFALLNLENPTEGSFLALDDMLISLDMSNRAKVVDFLLKISDRYKIYLFTHDRAFYNYVSREIQQHGKSKEWVYKTISYNAGNKEPIISDEYSDYLSKSKHFYSIGDYDTSAIYLRKQLEQSVGELLPYELKTRADGGFVDLQTLWDKLVTFYSNNGHPLELTMQKLFNDSKLLILNVAAHYQRLVNPIYRIELDKAYKLVEYLNTLEKVNNKLVIEGGKQIIFKHPNVAYQCSFELDSDLEIIQDEHIVARIPKCKNIKWSYNGIDNWDFETNMQNDNHKLLTSTPKITTFFSNCCEKLPLRITHDMLMKHCKVEGTVSLLDYFCGFDLLSLSIKTY